MPLDIYGAFAAIKHDSHFVAAGATIVPTAADAWAQAMVIKVKGPKEEEFQFLRADLTLFTYLNIVLWEYRQDFSIV